MKKLIALVLLSANVANAGNLIVNCENKNRVVGLNQFSLAGPISTDEGTASGAVSVILENRAGETKRLVMDVSGSSKIFAAGTYMKNEVELIQLKNDNGNERIKIVIGGPQFSSSLTINGAEYRSTCAQMEDQLLAK